MEREKTDEAGTAVGKNGSPSHLISSRQKYELLCRLSESFGACRPYVAEAERHIRGKIVKSEDR